MTEKIWPSAQQITNANGVVIKNTDGTISVYTFNQVTGQLAPQFLTKSWCDSLGIEGAHFDTTTQKCKWSDASCNTPFNIVLNPRGNDGTVFSVYPDEKCTLSVDFDYLFKFDCKRLTELATGTKNANCATILDVFESLGASMVIDVAPSQTQLTRVYEEQLFNVIGKGNLYNYLTSAGTNSGFFICGNLVHNTSDTSCHPLNLYDLNITGDTLNCGIAANQIINQLFAESGLAMAQLTAFTNNVNANAFGANWLHFHTEITGATAIAAMTNQKIKLSIKLSGTCIATCVLVDNIVLNQNCAKVTDTTIFVTQSPGFELDRIRDNKKSWVANTNTAHRTFDIKNINDSNLIRYTDYYLNEEQEVINTKEIDLDLNIAAAVETDVWNYISNNPCVLTGVTVGTTTSTRIDCSGNTSSYCHSDDCGDSPINLNALMTQPLSAVSTVEDFEYFITSELIDAKNRQTISSYPTLRLLYDRYMQNYNCATQSARFDYMTIDKFANLVGNYWVDIIEQVIPATTIWGSTKIYTNTIFDNQKFQYKGYTSLFGTNIYGDTNQSITGQSCGASVITTVIEGDSRSTASFFSQGERQFYTNMYAIQMNGGSEFFGTVGIAGPNAPTSNNSLNECLLSVGIEILQEPSELSFIGSIRANVYGASGPVTYSWNNGATTQTLTNLAAEIYSVTVTDGNCTAIAEVLLRTSPCTIILTTSSTSAQGILHNGTATASVSGGIPPYTYSWNTTPVQTTATATGLGAGTYTVMVNDVNCLVSSNVGVPVAPCILAATTSSTNALGNLLDGTVTANVITGIPPYTYSWNTSPVQTIATATGLAAGTYTATITDAWDCVITPSVVLSQTPCNLSVNLSSTNANGGLHDGTVTANVTSGAGGYTYSWNTTPVQTTATATGLAANTYTVNITDAWNCTFNGSVTVNLTPCNIAATMSSTNSTGNLLNGTATATVTSGAGGYTYSWNTSPVQTTSTATGLAAGTYTVTITDADSCTYSNSVAINNTPCTLAATTSSTNSQGNLTNGSVTANVTTGHAPYTYSWNTSPVQTTATATGLAAATYTCTITDAWNCVITPNATVTHTPCTLAATTSSTNSQGNLTNGTVTANVTAGAGGYTYSWNTSPVQTTATATGLAAGTYTCTITDAWNCVITPNATITHTPCDLAATPSSTNQQGNLTNGTVTANATSTAGGITYSWNTSPVQTTATATGLAAGTYTVTITDAWNCTIAPSVVLSHTPCNLAATLSSTSSHGVTHDGTATANVTSGAGSYTYSWNTSPVQTTAVATGLGAGTYTCTITDAWNCTINPSVIVNDASCTLAATISSTNTNGNLSTGTATVVVTAGAGGYTYSWNSSPVQTTATATGLPAGTYTCTITDSASCIITPSVAVGTNPCTLSATISMSNQQGNLINGTASVIVTAGHPPYTYSWNSSPVQTTATATGLVSGTYTCTISDAWNCTITPSIFVDHTPCDLTSTFSSTNSTGNLHNGTAIASATSSAGGITYSWNSVPVQTTATATGLSAGTYTCVLTDAWNCTFTGNSTVTLTPCTLGVTTGMTGDTAGGNGAASVTVTAGTAPYSYVWYTNFGEGQIIWGTGSTITGLSGNTYYVQVTDAWGCIVNTNVTVTSLPYLAIQWNAAAGVTIPTASLYYKINAGSYVLLRTTTVAYSPSWGTVDTITGLTVGDTVTMYVESIGGPTHHIEFFDSNAIFYCQTAPLTVTITGSTTQQISLLTNGTIFQYCPPII